MNTLDRDHPVFPDRPVRSFVAIPCPPGLREAIASALSRWSSIDAAVKWTDPGKLHLTLRFLGDAPPERLRELHRGLRESVGAAGPIRLAPSSTGAFPGWGRPRVLWLGFEESARLARLAEASEADARAAGFEPEERPFHPHLTVGRVKAGRGIRRVVEVLRGWSPGVEPEMADEIVLYRSELSSEGPRYTAMARYPLGGTEEG